MLCLYRTTKKEQSLISSGEVNPQQEYNEALAPKCIISLDGEFVNTSPEKLNYNRPETIKSTLEADKFPKAMVDYFTEFKKDIEGISETFITIKTSILCSFINYS